MRPDWTDYFMAMARLAAGRSTCLRRQVGAVLVREHHVIATGYNGAPTGLEHCARRGCLRQQLGVPSGQRHELCWGVHAEQNTIIQAARHGVSTVGAVLFCTNQPCSVCARILVNAGVVAVVACGSYRDALAREIFQGAGVELVEMGEGSGGASEDSNPAAVG